MMALQNGELQDLRPSEPCSACGRLGWVPTALPAGRAAALATLCWILWRQRDPCKTPGIPKSCCEFGKGPMQGYNRFSLRIQEVCHWGFQPSMCFRYKPPETVHLGTRRSSQTWIARRVAAWNPSAAAWVYLQSTCDSRPGRAYTKEL